MGVIRPAPDPFDHRFAEEWPAVRLLPQAEA